MQRIDLTDFSGGLSEQYAVEGFTNRQWSKVKGFVIDTESSIRSQWPAQSIGTITGGFLYVSGFVGSSNTYLIALGNDGFIYHTIAPSNNASYTTTNAVSWTKFTEIPPSTDYRFICEMLYPITNVGEVNALLINSTNQSLDNFAIYENDATNTLTVKAWLKHYPTDQLALLVPPEGTPTFNGAGPFTNIAIDSSNQLKYNGSYTQSIEADMYYTGTFGTTNLDLFRTYYFATGVTHPYNTGDNITINASQLAFADANTKILGIGDTNLSYLRTVGYDTGVAALITLDQYKSRVLTNSQYWNQYSYKGTVYSKTTTSVTVKVTTLTLIAASGGIAAHYVDQTGTTNNYLPITTASRDTISSSIFRTNTFSGTYITGIGNLIVNDSETKTISLYSFNSLTATETLITEILPKDTYLLTNYANIVLRIKSGQTGNITGRIGSKTNTATYPNPRQQAMPRATIGTMWRNRLVLGNIEKRIDGTQAWTATGNIQIAPYAFWYSGVLPDTFFEQAILYAGSGESHIIGLHVLDDALITISSPATDTDGSRIFRGTLDYLSLQNGNNVMNINVLRGGIGPVRNTTTNTPRKASALWPEAGIVAFLDHLGGVWYTNGSEVDRLDREGPRSPEITTTADEIEAVGRFLFVYRDGRLLCLNMLAGSKGNYATAAWSEIVLPTGKTISGMQRIDSNLFFIMDGKVYRLAMARNNQSDTERASFNGTQIKLTIGTATVGDVDKHQKVEWNRFAFRSKGNANNSKVYDVKVIAGPTLDSSKPSYTRTLDRVLDSRDEIVIPAGIGVATEASGEVTFYGDVHLESATFFTSGGRLSRPSGGSDA